jgi:hypothetical protein
MTMPGKAERRARCRSKWLAAGCCAFCGENRDAGSVRYCTFHLRQQRQRQRERRGNKPYKVGGRGKPPAEMRTAKKRKDNQ